MPFSAKEIATRIAPTEDAVQSAFERIRHWTREGLLSPEGEENPGTGRKRLYGENEIKKARLFNALADFGIGLRTMKGIGQHLDNKDYNEYTLGYSSILVIERSAIGENKIYISKVQNIAEGVRAPLHFGSQFALVVNLTLLFAE